MEPRGQLRLRQPVEVRVLDQLALFRRQRRERLKSRGVEYVRPSTAERDQINQIIFGELAYGVTSAHAVAYFQSVIARMKDEGCDGVVLGCTEIPLLMNDANSPLPTLDSTRLLDRAALRRAATV